MNGVFLTEGHDAGFVEQMIQPTSELAECDTVFADAFQTRQR